jgi:hypothetical protein
MNDPVMGGRSKATLLIHNGVAVFDGTVVNVPFLQSPGFVTMRTKNALYPDISSCRALQLDMHNNYNADYTGYRFSFGNIHVPGGRFAYGYKANFLASSTVKIPFHNFTSKWDDATGDAIVTCHDDARYCPTRHALQNLQTMSIWGEGVQGNLHLEIRSIRAVDCNDSLWQLPLEEHTTKHIDIGLLLPLLLLVGGGLGIVVVLIRHRRPHKAHYESLDETVEGNYL